HVVVLASVPSCSPSSLSRRTSHGLRPAPALSQARDGPVYSLGEGELTQFRGREIGEGMRKRSRLPGGEIDAEHRLELVDLGSHEAGEPGAILIGEARERVASRLAEEHLLEPVLLRPDDRTIEPEEAREIRRAFRRASDMRVGRDRPLVHRTVKLLADDGRIKLEMRGDEIPPALRILLEVVEEEDEDRRAAEEVEPAGEVGRVAARVEDL